MNVRTGIAKWGALAVALPALVLSGCANFTELSNADTGDGCGAMPAQEKLTNWAGTGGGVVRARVQLTGRQVTTDDHGALTVYSELQIDGAEVVAGKDPRVTSGWVEGGKKADGDPVPTRGPSGSLWGPDGSSVLVIDPSDTVRDNPDKVTIHITPLVDNDLILTNAGCWSFPELQTKPFSGALSEVPGSQTADAMRGAMRAGSYSDFVALAKKVLGSH